MPTFSILLIKILSFGNKHIMEYAISITVAAVFIAVYLLTRPKIRAEYFDVYDDLEYGLASKEYVRSLSLPKESGKTDVKKYVSRIKLITFKIKSKKYGDFFDCFNIFKEDVAQLLKTDLSELEALPSIDNEARAVKLARFCLAHSNYKFDDGRVRTIIEEQNKRKTLSFSEIMSMQSAFLYVYIEKLCYIYLQLETLAKIYDLSAKYVYNPILLDEKYKKLTKSRLFLSICARYAGYKNDYFADIYKCVLDNFCNEIKDILSDVKRVQEYDFSRYYTPLEILDKFEIFSNSPPSVKNNFLKLIKEQSDKENLDEFLYTMRLEKYMKSASAGHIRVKKANLFSHTLCFINHKRDITMLATALGSRHFMNLYFAPNNNSKRKLGKSISKMLEFENTFEPIYKFRTINFGISTVGGKLRVSPALPRQIDRADVVFDVNGVKNNLHIERGEEKQMFLGDTLITGVEQIKLGDKPLDITVKVPKSD